MAVPLDIYTCASFLEMRVKNPQALIDLVFLADIDAGVKFGAPRRRCTHLDETSVRALPLYVPLLHALTLAWEKCMKGLEIRPVPGAGHGLFVKDQSLLNTRVTPNQETVVHVGFTVRVPMDDDCLDTHRLDISSQQDGGSSKKKNMWWLHGPIRLANHDPHSTMSLRYDGRAAAKTISIANYVSSGEVTWHYFRGFSEEKVIDFTREMLTWSRDECCKAENTSEVTPCSTPASTPAHSLGRMAEPDKALPEFAVLPEPESVDPEWLQNRTIRLFESCPLCGNANRGEKKTNQKHHLATRHAEALLPRASVVKKMEYDEQLYIRINEIISFCQPLWNSQLIPIHLGLFAKKAFEDQGEECRSAGQLMREVHGLMGCSTYVPFFLVDGRVQIIREENAVQAFEAIPASASAVLSVPSTWGNKVAAATASPEYAAAGQRGALEAKTYLFHCFRCLSHGATGCAECVSVSVNQKTVKKKPAEAAPSSSTSNKRRRTK